MFKPIFKQVTFNTKAKKKICLQIIFTIEQVKELSDIYQSQVCAAPGSAALTVEI